MQVLTQFEGLSLIAAFFGVMWIFLTKYNKKSYDKTYFLVANRNITGLIAAISIASTWIWAPALFVSSEKAYTQGIVGVFWFIVPNVLTLVLFGFFAEKMRNRLPKGWTFSDHIRQNYSNRTHTLYLAESFGLQTMSFAVQLLAVAGIFNSLTGIPFWIITVAFVIVPLIHTMRAGIRISIFADYQKMIWIGMILFLGIYFMLTNDGIKVISQGIGGISGQFTDFFSGKGLSVTLSFGIPTTIGLLAATFGDQMMWQRVFSVRQNEVKRAFLTSSIIFATVPISLSLFGFVAAGKGLEVTDTQLTNVASALSFAPFWFVPLFMTMIMAGLVSTIDSIICAVSSLSGHDIAERLKKRTDKKYDALKLSRFAMITVACVAVGTANIPGLKILHLFLIYGILRASVTLPTVFAILGKRMSEKGLFYGLLTSMCIGFPIFVYGNFSGKVSFIVFGSLFTILASGLIARYCFRPKI